MSEHSHEWWCPQNMRWCCLLGTGVPVRRAVNYTLERTSILYCETAGTCLTFWRAAMAAPNDSPYAGGLFKLDVTIPRGYPFYAPVLRFRTKIYHPNITEDGFLCFAGWCPALKIASLLILVQALLSPMVLDMTDIDQIVEGTCPGNVAAAAAFAQDPAGAFAVTARQWTQRYAMGEDIIY